MTRRRTPTTRRLSAEEIARFWAKVDRTGGPTACWPWTGARRGGYGNFRAAGRNWYPHRLAWILTANGGRDTPLDVLHNPPCNNGLCCNPAHLREGTPVENAADMDAQGRRAEHHGGHPKLNPTIAATIRTSTESGYVLAARYNVAVSLISAIRNNRIWRGREHRLTVEVARTIRARLAAGERGVDLAKEYGVSKAAISRVRRRSAWA